jgi:hypothetical protein
MTFKRPHEVLQVGPFRKFFIVEEIKLFFLQESGQILFLYSPQ